MATNPERPDHLFKSEITMRDCVGSMTDELSYLYRASSYELRSGGIKLDFRIRYNENGSYLSDGETVIHRLTQLHANLMGYFYCWTKNVGTSTRNDMVKAVPKMVLPVLFSKESIMITLSSKKFGTSKSIVVPVDSKTFHSNVHPAMRQKNVVDAFYQDRIKHTGQADDHVIIIVKLASDPSPDRQTIDLVAHDLGTRLLEYMVGSDRAEELKGRVMHPKSVISLAHAVTVEGLTDQDDIAEAERSLNGRVHGVRDLIDRIQCGGCFDRPLLNNIIKPDTKAQSSTL
jgi:hypothetical protein